MEWLKEAQPIAYGALALKPWEFGKLQPWEFEEMLKGYIWRQERSDERTAYFVCALLNVEGKSLKHKITARELLKPLRPKEKRDYQAEKAYLYETFPQLKGG